MSMACKNAHQVIAIPKIAAKVPPPHSELMLNTPSHLGLGAPQSRNFVAIKALCITLSVCDSPTLEMSKINPQRST